MGVLNNSTMTKLELYSPLCYAEKQTPTSPLVSDFNKGKTPLVKFRPMSANTVFNSLYRIKSHPICVNNP